MSLSSSVSAMIALAAVLSAPLLIEAQTSLSEPVALPATAMLASRARGGDGPIAPGAAVYNEQNDRIGSIAEVLASDRADGVVLSSAATAASPAGWSPCPTTA